VKLLEFLKIHRHFFVTRTKRIVLRVFAEKVKMLDKKKGEVKEIDIPAKDSPAVQIQAKPTVDEPYVLSVFLFADEVMKFLLPKIKK